MSLSYHVRAARWGFVGVKGTRQKTKGGLAFYVSAFDAGRRGYIPTDFPAMRCQAEVASECSAECDDAKDREV